MTTQVVHAEYSGPLPPASQFERYEQILPGSAERIMAQWEGQSNHRQRLEAKVVDSNISAQKAGQWMAFILALTVMGVAVWLFASGLEGWALATVVSDLAALGLINRKAVGRQEQERREKDRAIRR